MNVFVLATNFAAEYIDGYPLYLAPSRGNPILLEVIKKAQRIQPKQIMCSFLSSEIEQFHLHDVVKQISPDIHIFSLREHTAGAACTALLGVPFFDNDEELVIVSTSEIVDVDYQEVTQYFRVHDCDAGCITFPSIHPRYSYLKIDEEGFVKEAAEKTPISQHAGAGFYWYRRGRDFVESAKEIIKKEAKINDRFYISSTFNEMILKKLKIGTYPIDESQYYPLKSSLQMIDFHLTKDNGRKQ